MKRWIGVLVVAVLVAIATAVGLWWAAGGMRDGDSPRDAAASQGGEVPPRPSDAFAMTVASVWDGDTLRATAVAPNAELSTTDETRVRLIGIDTAEVGSPSECWAEEARAHLASLLPEGSTVWAVFDADPVDRYERALLYLWTDDGTFVNHELVTAGDAEALLVEPNNLYAALFEDAEADARAAAVGRWGACV